MIFTLVFAMFLSFKLDSKKKRVENEGIIKIKDDRIVCVLEPMFLSVKFDEKNKTKENILGWKKENIFFYWCSEKW